MHAVKRHTKNAGDEDVVDEGISRLVLALAHFCARSPADLSKELVRVIGERMRPPQIVEVFNWLSVLGLLQRLYAFYIPESCP